jgi:hypothetical protein
MIPESRDYDPKFDLFGETFTFVETFSGTVIDSNPGNGQIWVKTNTGDEKQISTMVSLSEVHTLSINTSFASIVRMVRMMHIKMRLSLIRTRENTSKLKRKTIIIPLF